MRSLKPVITSVVLMLVFVSPFIISRFWVPQNFVNNGELIDPPVSWIGQDWQIKDPALTEADVLTEKWRLLLVADSSCDSQCQEGLYHIRQLRLTQGRNMEEVGLLWLMSDNEFNNGPELAQDYELVQQIKLANMESSNQQTISVAGVELQKNNLYLIDPLGNIMMHFAQDLDPSLIKKDLKRLIKVYNSVSVYNKDT